MLEFLGFYYVWFSRNRRLKLEKIPGVSSLVTPLRGCGVDGEIHRRTGMELFKFCKKLPIFNKKKRAQILPGQVICSPGFDLPTKFIFHCNGPANGNEVVVARTYQSD